MYNQTLRLKNLRDSLYKHFFELLTELQQKPPQSATPPTSVSSWCELFAENLAFTYYWRTIWQSKLKLTSFMTESVFKCAVLMPSKQIHAQMQQ